MKELKKECCLKYEEKAKACKRCPIMAQYTKKQRRKKLRKIRKKLKVA